MPELAQPHDQDPGPVKAPARSYAVLGIDPGPKPGTCLRYPAGTWAWPGGLEPGLLELARIAGHDPDVVTVVALERFVLSRRSARATSQWAGRHTLAQQEQLVDLADRLGHKVSLRNAGEVKAWASDARLREHGLWLPGADRRHDRDAARHALFYLARARVLS